MHKPIIIIIIASLLYIVLIKPLRGIINHKVFFPVLSMVLPDDEVSLPLNNSAMIILESKMDEGRVWISFPFGGFYFVPLALFAYKKNKKYCALLTYYHVGFFILSFILALATSRNIFSYFPTNMMNNMLMALGFIFTIIAVNSFFNNENINEH